MEKKRILCFGDSMTWGFDPETHERFPEDIRWTGVLQELLGEEYKIIEEGQCGRTIATDDPAEGEKNGLKYILPCLESQSPLDLLVLMLGSNDLKRKFHYASIDIAGEMQSFLEKVITYNHFRQKDRMKILLISPPYIGANIRSSWLGDDMEYERSIEVSKELADWYRQLADMYGCAFLDAAKHIVVSQMDSVHPDADNQKKLGQVIYETVLEQKLL